MPPRLGRFSCLVVTLVAVAIVVSAVPSTASAHSSLIRSTPEAGSRLASAPATMKLYFNEPFIRGTQQVTLRRAGGETVALPKARVAGAVIEQPLPPKLRGVFIVSWRVLSDDGHISVGELSFAAGSTGALPSVRNPSQGRSWSEIGASWLLFIGVALGLGGLVSERVVWRRTSAQRTVIAAPVAVGLVLATTGALLELVLLAGNERGGGFESGLHGAALADALGTRPGRLSLATLVALAIAGMLVPLRRLRLVAVVPLLAAVVFIADRGHSGTASYGWAVVAAAIHLAAVAVWLGALAHLVLIIVRAEAPRAGLLDGARRYSRYALPTVLVVLTSGVLTAIPEFRSVGAVFTSGYGQTLLVKLALVGVALLLAFVDRTWVLPANPHPRLPLLRRLTLAESTTLAGVLVVAAVLVNAAPPRSQAQAASASSARPPSGVAPSTLAPGGDAVTPPPPGSVVLGREDGDLAVGLAVAPGRQLVLQATVLGQDGGGVAGLDVTFRVQGTASETSTKATACGSGCYRAHVAASGKPVTVSISIAGGGRSPSTVRFLLPTQWPPPRATTLVAQATRVFRGLRTLITHERLASSTTNVVNTTYEAVAPNRLAYQIAGGSDAIIIGDRRWDRGRPGGKWQRSSQEPLRQPAPFWASVRDAHIIGTTNVDGRSAWLVSFYDPGTPAFFTIAVDRKTLRTLDLRMTAAAHFMHHRYTGFNAPVAIAPPGRGTDPTRPILGRATTRPPVLADHRPNELNDLSAAHQ